MCLPDRISYLWHLFISLPFECKHPKRQSCLPFFGNYIFLLGVELSSCLFLQFDIPQAWVEKQVYKCHFIAYCIALSLFSLVKCTCIYSFNYCRKEQSIYIYVMIIFHKEAHCMSLDRYMLLSFTLKSISWYILYSIFNFYIIVHVYYSCINTVHRNFLN